MLLQGFVPLYLGWDDYKVLDVEIFIRENKVIYTSGKAARWYSCGITKLSVPTIRNAEWYDKLYT